jgi:hypothetical protein
VYVALRTWARQKRRAMTNLDAYGNIDNAPGSIFGRLRYDREASGDGRQIMQRWLEIYDGDGLLVQRAIQGCPELPRLTVIVHWVCQGYMRLTVHERVALVGRLIDAPLSTARYWTALDAGEHWIAARLTEAPQVTEIV